MEQNRREFLKTAAVGAGWLMVGGCDFDACVQQIANRPTRKDVNTLAANDPIIEAYKSAVAQMKGLRPDDHRNWIAQADIHANYCPHGNWLFLPWHRWYLTYFERICQKLSGVSDFALPYWNWVKDPTVPAVFWGDASNPLYDGTRTIGQATAISASLVGCQAVGDIMNDPNFFNFASDSITLAQGQRTGAGFGALEGTPHNGVHGAIGGNMGQVALSPRDPIFWLHHNMIEKCWVEWQLVRNNANTDDPNWIDRHFTEFYDADGNAVDVTVGVGLLLPAVSYQFDNLPVIPPGCAGGAGAPPPGPAGAGSMGAGWERLNTVRTRAAQEALKRRAQSGAAVKRDVLRRFPLERPAAVALGEATALPVPADAAALRSAIAAGQRTLIRFGDVSLNHTTDFFAKVFIDKPDANASTPDTDPHFVGAFAFFDHQHDGKADLGNFHLDASAVLRRLGAEKGTVDVSIVLAPFPNREPKTTSLELGSVEIQIVKDVIETHER